MCDFEEGEFLEYQLYLEAASTRVPAAGSARTPTSHVEGDRQDAPVPLEAAASSA